MPQIFCAEWAHGRLFFSFFFVIVFFVIVFFVCRLRLHRGRALRPRRGCGSCRAQRGQSRRHDVFHHALAHDQHHVGRLESPRSTVPPSASRPAAQVPRRKPPGDSKSGSLVAPSALATTLSAFAASCGIVGGSALPGRARPRVTRLARSIKSRLEPAPGSPATRVTCPSATRPGQSQRVGAA